MSNSKSITLPSGKRARMVVYDPARPWEPYPDGKLFRLRRARRGDSSQWEYLKNASAMIDTFVESDLDVLLESLASWTSERQRFPTTGAPDPEVDATLLHHPRGRDRDR